MVCPCSQLIYDPIMDNVDMLKKLWPCAQSMMLFSIYNKLGCV
jgi:hypothetical protein